ncbi:MAG: hypothetical protein Q8M09_11700 [Pseudomonadota bacterium]|nr:hypothetical protein [Pseudomonadota bacterium]MDP1904893.1 hypothetical protein [Pseudomonadota bacterium]MDP2353422.1 hypothetical protein [Pseudomonadota bacterium]
MSPALLPLRYFSVSLFLLLLAGFPVLAAPPAGISGPAAAGALAAPQVLKNSPELASLLRDWDSQSALAIEVARQKPTQVLNRAAMRRTRVDTGTGEQVDMAALFDQTFTAQRALGQQLSRISDKALVKRPQINEVVVEFPDRLLLARQVRMVVRDPRQAAADSPEFAAFLAPVDKAAAARARVAELPSDEQADFRRFLAEELPQLEADDPLREALASGGEDAVLRAVLSGAGEFEVTDEVVVERRLFNDGGPRLPMSLRPMARPLIFTPVVRRALRPAQPLTATAAKQDGRGRLEFNEPFLAGFTLGQELKWERKWKFNVGFLRLTYSMGYGVGLRIPLRLEGSLTPISIERSAPDDPGHDLTLQLRATAFNAGPEYYLAAGLDPTQVFDGNEFVLEVGSSLNYKLYLLGKDRAKGTLPSPSLVQSRDFTPPLGGTAREIFPTIAIPPELTNTTLELGALRGDLTLGFSLRGDGAALSQVSLLVDDAPREVRPLPLRDTGGITETLRLHPLAAGVQRQRYGLRIAAPQYQMNLSVVPQLQVGMDIGVGEFRRGIRTDWFDLISHPLGQITLPPHAGTRDAYQWNEGVRIFHKETREPSAPAGMRQRSNILLPR